MLRVSLILLVVPSLSIVSSASEEGPFNVDFFCGWSGHYRPMEWTPVEIGITSTLTEPFAGYVTIAAQQDGLNTMNITHEFVLTPDIPLHLPLVTKFAFTAEKCGVRLFDKNRNRIQWHHDFDLWDFSSGNRLLTTVGEHDLLIGLVGRGKFGLLRLPKESICQSRKGQGKVYIGDKLPRMVPWDWTGYVPLDVLVIYDPDWNLFNHQQVDAIAKWISNGGRLLLVLGSHPLSSSNPIAQLLPFEFKDIKQVTVPPETLQEWGLIPGEPETVNAWSLVPKPEARFYETEVSDANECLFATGYAGFGRVGVLAFDPSIMTDKQRTNTALFWVLRIRAILEDAHSLPYDTSARRPRPNRISRSIGFVSDAEGSISGTRTQNQYEVGWAHAANNAVMEFLYQEIRPLSIWWVILLLTALALLLGPVDYKVLKRKDRLPLTWLTCSFWIILFTIGAYYGVQALRGGDMDLRVVSVLDGIEKSNHTWSTDYCGLFAPYSDDYRLKDLQDNQWWSGIAPTQESIWIHNREVGSRRIYCFQHDGGNLPYSLPINIWTIQCLLKESSVQKLPFDAEVQRQGDEIAVRIVNESESPILTGYVLLGNDRGINFGPVPAGASKQFRKQLKTMRIWGGYNTDRYREYYSRRRNYSVSFKKEDAFFAQGCLQRTQTISAYLDRGAAVVCAEYDQAPLSFAVEDRSYNPTHIQLVRLIVFPKEQKEETGNDRNRESH